MYYNCSGDDDHDDGHKYDSDSSHHSQTSQTKSVDQNMASVSTISTVANPSSLLINVPLQPPMPLVQPIIQPNLTIITAMNTNVPPAVSVRRSVAIGNAPRVTKPTSRRVNTQTQNSLITPLAGSATSFSKSPTVSDGNSMSLVSVLLPAPLLLEALQQQSALQQNLPLQASRDEVVFEHR